MKYSEFKTSYFKTEARIYQKDAHHIAQLISTGRASFLCWKFREVFTITEKAPTQVVILAQNCVHSCEALVCPIHNLNYI